MAKLLGNNELNSLKQKSPFSLPDNPSDKGLNASQIKAKFYEGLLLLFNWLKETKVELNNEENIIKNLQTLFTDGKANYSINDSLGNKIDETYAKKNVVDSNVALIAELDNDIETLKVDYEAVCSTLREVVENQEDNVKYYDIASNKNDLERKLATLGQVKTLIADLVNQAPETLDTLSEIAIKIAEMEDEDYSLLNLINNVRDLAKDIETFGIVKTISPLVNISGKSLTDYEAIFIANENPHYVVKTSEGEYLNETQAKAFLKAFIGSEYLPVNNYDTPKYSYIYDSKYAVYKVQFDNSEGLKFFVMGELAKKDDYCPNFKAGLADQLKADIGTRDTNKYIFRTSGNSVSVEDGNAELRSIRGNTVVWNQCVKTPSNTTTTSNGITWTYDEETHTIIGSGTATGVNSTFNFGHQIPNHLLVLGHKYLVSYEIVEVSEAVSQMSVGPFNIGPGCYSWRPFNAGYKTFYNKVFNTGNERWYGVSISGFSAGQQISVTLRNFQMFNLTLMFGNGNEPATLEDFISFFPKPYYAYDSGTLKNVSITGIRTIGYNAFDGQLEIGTFGNSGVKTSSNKHIRSTNYIKVVGGQTYSFDSVLGYNYTSSCSRIIFEFDEAFRFIGATTKSEPINTIATITLNSRTRYVALALEDNTAQFNSLPTGLNFCFHLTLSGNRTGFEEYKENVRHINYVNGLNGVGSAFDEIIRNKKITRFASLNLGTLNWTYYPNQQVFRAKDMRNLGLIKAHTNNGSNSLTNKYINMAVGAFINNTSYDKVFGIYGDGDIDIRDTSYTDVNTFKQSLNGVILIYEMATPIEEFLPREQDLVYKVSDYGTEEFISNDDIVIPVGHETIYLANLRDKLQNTLNCLSIYDTTPYANKDYVLSFDNNGVASLKDLSVFEQDITNQCTLDPFWTYNGIKVLRVGKNLLYVSFVITTKEDVAQRIAGQNVVIFPSNISILPITGGTTSVYMRGNSETGKVTMLNYGTKQLQIEVKPCSAGTQYYWSHMLYIGDWL